MIYNNSKRFLPIYKQEITPSTPDYSTLPLTFECISGSNSLGMPMMSANVTRDSSLWGSSASPIIGMSARVMEGNTVVSAWFDWKAKGFSYIPLTAGQRIELTGNSTYFSKDWDQWNNRFRFTGNSASMIVYGNLSSVIESGITAINMQHIFYQGENTPTETNYVLIDASKLVIPFAPSAAKAFEGSWGYNKNLSALPLWTTTAYNSRMFNHSLKGNTSLKYIDVCFETTYFPNFDGPWMAGISQSGYFIKSPNTAIPNSRNQYTIPNNWVILNRDLNKNSSTYGKLTYAEAKLGHSVGDEFAGEDPYTWYYKRGDK